MARALAPQLIPPEAQVIAYCRVSTDRQAGDDTVSLAEQERACRAYAAQGGRVVDVVLTDVESGRSTARPRFVALLRHCQQHPRHDVRGLVIVLDQSRWGRFVDRPSLATSFMDQLWMAGWDVQFVREQSTNTDADSFLHLARSHASVAESRRIAQRATMGMTAQAQQGHWQGRPPFGYQRVAVSRDGKERPLDSYDHAARGERVRLVLGDPADVETVKHLYHRFLAGEGLTAIAEALEARDVRGPFDTYRGRVTWWTAATVRALLMNPAYRGVLRFNRRAPKDHRGRVGVRGRADWIEMDGAVPAMVSAEDWHAVQARLTALRPRHRGTAHYALTGLLTCARCGGPMVGGGGTRPGTPDPDAARFYRCRASTGRRRTCGPRMVTVNQRFLERAVADVTAKLVRQATRGGALERALDRLLAARTGTVTTSRADLDRERATLTARRKRLLDRIAKGLITDEEAAESLAELRAALEERDMAVQQGRFAQRANALTDAERATLLARAQDVPSRLREAQTANPALFRTLLEPWLAGVVVDPEERTARVRVRTVPAGVGAAPDDVLATGDPAGRS